MSRPRLLDLFCGAGGAGYGYHLAGFDVVGVDLDPQPNYPFEFHQADALAFPLDGFDAIHASPPCQAHTSMKRVAWNYKTDHQDFIWPVRARLRAAGVPYIIENVPEAPLLDPMRLCGTSFGLGVETCAGYREVRRHRLFESNTMLLSLPCNHKHKAIGIYGVVAHGRTAKLNFSRTDTVQLGRDAMQMPWCQNFHELAEAIPPAYTEHIGRQIVAAMEIAA